MRKSSILVIMLISLFSSNASATFYFGTGGGATFGTVISQFIYPVDTSHSTQATYDYGLAAFTPRISLGYRHPIGENWGWDTLMSAEFNMGTSVTEVNNWFPDTNASSNITLPFVGAFDILGTYRLNPEVSSFFGPGVALGEFDTISTVTGGVTGISGSYHKFLIGGQLMAGVNLLLTETVTLRLSDQLTFFPSAKTAWIEPISEQAFSGSYTIMINSVMATILLDL